jgi:hypothetical protein
MDYQRLLVSKVLDVEVDFDAKRRVLAVHSIHGLPVEQVVGQDIGIVENDIELGLH